MPKLIVPEPQQPSAEFKHPSIGAVSSSLASGAEIGNIQRTEGARAYASGADIGMTQISAGNQLAQLGQQYVQEAQGALDDSVYNSAFSKASIEYNKRVQERLDNPYDADGNPTFGTLQDDLAKIGDEVSNKYGSTIASPGASQRFNQSMNNLTTQTTIGAGSKARTQQVEYAQGSLKQLVQANTTNALAADNRPALDLYHASNVEAIDSAVKNGYITSEEGVQLKELSRNKIYYGYMQNKNILNPDGAKKDLELKDNQLRINATEKAHLVANNNTILEHKAAQQRRIENEQEKALTTQQGFNTKELELGIGRGEVSEPDIVDAYQKGMINAGQRDDLRMKVDNANGISAKKTATRKAINADITNKTMLDGKYTTEQVNDWYADQVSIKEKALGKSLTLIEKTDIVDDANTKSVPKFTGELAAVLQLGDPDRVKEAAVAIDVLSKKNPLLVASLDRNSLAIAASVQDKLQYTNIELGAAVEQARKNITNISPTEQELRNKRFSGEEKFNNKNINATINDISGVSSGWFGMYGKQGLDDNTRAVYARLLKDAYSQTGNVSDAINMVKLQTGGTIGPSAINKSAVTLNRQRIFPTHIETDVSLSEMDFSDNKATGNKSEQAVVMFAPPEKIYPMSPTELRQDLDKTLAPVLAANPLYKNINPNNIMIGSDEVTRAQIASGDPKNPPSYYVYYVDDKGIAHQIYDKNTKQPQRWYPDTSAIQQQREEEFIPERKAAQEAGPQTLKDILQTGGEGMKSMWGTGKSSAPIGPEAKSIYNNAIQKSTTSTNPLDIATAFVGAHETQGRQVLGNFISRQLGTRIDPSRTPWCAAFTSAVLIASGHKAPKNGGLIAVELLNYGTPTLTPQMGDVVVTHSLVAGSTGHAGFFAGYEYQNGVRYVKILGGNSNNQVREASVPEKMIAGYRIPPTIDEVKQGSKTHPEFNPNYYSGGKMVTGDLSISSVYAAAHNVHKENEILGDLATAQAILESRLNGNPSGLAKHSNNLFGIKGKGTGGSVKMPTKEHIKGKNITVNADFAKNNSLEDSFIQHANLLNKDRYSNVKRATSFEEAARAIAAAGYATDPTYAKQLINIYNTYIKPLKGKRQ